MIRLLGRVACHHRSVHLLLPMRWVLTVVGAFALVLALVVASVVMVQRPAVWILDDFDFGLRLSSFAPVDGWPRAHVPTQHLFLVQVVDQLGCLARNLFSGYQVLHEVIGVSFDVPQELVVPLNLEHHLAVDVLDVEVFASHQKGASPSCIQGQAASSYLVDTEGIESTIRLL